MSAKTLTNALGGCWYGYYGTACCPAHDDHNHSLSIRAGETRAVLLHCFSGCEYRDIRASIEHKLGAEVISDTEHWRNNPVPKSAPKAKADLIKRIWAQTIPVQETHADQYLRQRSIAGPLPHTLRFHPSLRHPTGGHLPAMVARVDDVDGNTTAVHRTYLYWSAPEKTDRVPSKAMLGPCRGNAVHLREGRAGLVICEGIETGLSIGDAFQDGVAIWAALSAPGMAALCLPNNDAFAGSLIIACDGDAAGRRAGHALRERALRHGWFAEIVSAPDGMDFNDLAGGKNG